MAARVSFMAEKGLNIINLKKTFLSFFFSTAFKSYEEYSCKLHDCLIQGPQQPNTCKYARIVWNGFL